ncbi:cysteine desulfurase family protein [Nonomuraea rubra]
MSDVLPTGLSDGPVYLDYNATTPMDPRVAEAMTPYLTTWFGNPSSSHRHAERPRQALTAATEHPAVLETCRALRRLYDARVTTLPVDGDGLVDAVALEDALAEETALVSIMAATNETGVLQPIPDLAALAHARGALFHCDAAGLAAHDLAAGAPARLGRLRDDLHHRLATALPDRVHLNGSADRRLPNTLNISIDGVLGSALLAAAPSMAASTGSACHSGTHTPSPVLSAMGQGTGRALSAVRLSLGRWSTGTDIETAATALINAATGGR